MNVIMTEGFCWTNIKKGKENMYKLSDSFSKLHNVFRVLAVIAILFLQHGWAAGHNSALTALCYVDTHAKGANNGTSWTDAFTDLQSALGISSCTEIWVAAGIYKPGAGADRNATFQLKDGVALYGGFNGTETAREQRNPIARLSILSGDGDSNDGQSPIITDLTSVTGNITNSYHVVTGHSGAILDGFIITAGYADDTDVESTHFGGGMYNYSCYPTLNNLTFIGNYSSYDGGGMHNEGGSGPYMTNINFIGNSSAHDGGGLSAYGEISNIYNATFSGNSAGENGGGIYNNSSYLTLINVTFSGNSADLDGGGMYNLGNYGGSGDHLSYVTFSGNSVNHFGGGMFNSGLKMQIDNTIFWNNTAPQNGQGQIYNLYAIDNNIGLINSVVQLGCPPGSICDNIIITDPKLGILGDYGGFTNTIPLLEGSSAIDMGLFSQCPLIDQRGVTRPQGKYCDIGAFEYPISQIYLPLIYR
jgi:predicted outer membrane repeat protein